MPLVIDDTFDLAAFCKEIETDEGRRRLIYHDTMGIETIGVGRNLQRGLGDDEIDYLRDNDIAIACAALDKNVSWWRTLPKNQQRVMVNLCFNMGWPRLALFTHFLAYMQAGLPEQAAVELKNSRWWDQVGARGPRTLERLLKPDTAHA